MSKIKIYDESLENILSEDSIDLSKGELVPFKMLIGETEAKAEIQEVGEYVIVKEYENGGKDVEWVVTTPYQAYEEAKPIYENIFIYKPYSKEYINKIRIEEISARLRKITEDEIQIIWGLDVPDIEVKRIEAKALLQEIRELEGKAPRDLIDKDGE